MTRPALQQLTLREIRQRGRDARQMTLPFHTNPFYRSTDLDLEEWASRCAAWSDGWVQKDAGRDERMQRLMWMRVW